jgi:hypothetical protein
MSFQLRLCLLEWEIVIEISWFVCDVFLIKFCEVSDEKLASENYFKVGIELYPVPRQNERV